MADGKKRVLGGRYEITSVIGEGGMAKVFLGTDRVLGRTVAVKVLSPQFAEDEAFVSRFRREAQAAAALSHPNVVSVFDTGSTGNVHYIVMEHVEGRTLRDVIREGGKVLPQRAIEITETVARALAAAHAKGLVHRDVKPGNIMVTREGEVKVMDFGIARATSANTVTQTAAVLGTASYLSPEQAQGEPVDARSDLYSLGVVLYEMLTGRAPFEGDSAVSVAYKHVAEDPVPPRRHNADVPESLEAIVLKSMAKNPDNRYQSANELADDLHRARQGLPVAATPVLTGERTQMIDRASHTQVLGGPLEIEEPPPRRTGLIIAITLIVVGILGAAGYFLAQALLAGGEPVRVPNVRGLQEEDATKELERLAFVVEVERKVKPLLPPGEVYDQDPKVGEMIDKGSVVTIFVARPPQQVEVPSVVGETEEDATAILEDAGFEVTTEQEESEEEQGTVIAQQPEGDSLAPRGSEVTLTVSSGPTTVPVPGVVCEPMDAAQAEIEDAGLVFEEIGSEFSEECQADTVASQSPAADTEVAPGTTVQVTRSLGASPPPSPTDFPSIIPDD